MNLARHQGEFKAAAEATVDVDELLGALGRPPGPKAANRREAIANCLSAGEGWRDSAARLGGAFASLGKATGLTDGKE
ncbi:MAG: hypothetical protein LH485_01895 [Sphingomonas bacterium]|nr:hypothetical protein [Sphingomonas bacterium]